MHRLCVSTVGKKVLEPRKFDMGGGGAAGGHKHTVVVALAKRVTVECPPRGSQSRKDASRHRGPLKGREGWGWLCKMSLTRGREGRRVGSRGHSIPGGGNSISKSTEAGWSLSHRLIVVVGRLYPLSN